MLSGNFHIANGDKLDEAKGIELTAGGFGVAPAGMNHFAWTTGDTIVQVHGEGLSPAHLCQPGRRSEQKVTWTALMPTKERIRGIRAKVKSLTNP